MYARLQRWFRGWRRGCAVHHLGGISHFQDIDSKIIVVAAFNAPVLGIQGLKKMI